LRRVRGDDLVFSIGGDDFDRDVFETREKEPLPHPRFKQEILFFIGEVKCFWSTSIVVGDCFKRSCIDEFVRMGRP